jgi:hypothetical protein
MNTSQAKETLLRYRWPIDDTDPQLEEALAYARRDPELADWVREQSSCYNAIRSKLREIEPPSDLVKKIIRERPLPFPRRWTPLLQFAAAIIVLVSVNAVALRLSQRERHPLVQGQEIVVKGEVLDMTCYIAHNLSGPEHAQCAKECIKKGLPVGIKGEDGKVYLLVGQTQPVNAQLADYAAKTVTIRGKETVRDGFAQLQVEEIRKF